MVEERVSEEGVVGGDVCFVFVSFVGGGAKDAMKKRIRKRQ